MKKLLSSLVVASMLLGTSGVALAKDVTDVKEVIKEVKEVSSDSPIFTPSMAFRDDYYLTTTSWELVATEPNNWLKANVNVTNFSSNSGGIYFYIEDHNGKTYSSTYVGPGEMKTIKGVATGGYDVYAKAATKAGTYDLTIDDWPI
ncbi:hypothetical protein [Paenibacillus macerans]|uniref:hypothetical protein n=1 Tax=Paenibacillus macerans TaxID=44252 RepID=UPI003D32438A